MFAVACHSASMDCVVTAEATGGGQHLEWLDSHSTRTADGAVTTVMYRRRPVADGEAVEPAREILPQVKS